MSTSASSSSSSSVATTGRRPTNSGIRPTRIRSSGCTAASRISPICFSLAAGDLGAEARGSAAPTRCSMIFSSPTNAPPQMNRMLRGVDLQELLLRVLAAALGRHVGDRALDDLEQRLLHALAGDVAGDRRVVALARDLVDLVDVDDAALGPLDVVVGVLQQLEDDVLDVLADVAGLGQGGGVGDGEGHLEDARQRLREQRLARAGRAEQQDVRLLQLDVVRAPPASRCACSGCGPRPRGPSWRAPGRSRTRRGWS